MMRKTLVCNIKINFDKGYVIILFTGAIFFFKWVLNLTLSDSERPLTYYDGWVLNFVCIT